MRLPVLICLAAVGCGGGGSAEPDGPRSVVFSDEAACAELTQRDGCGWTMCDFVPEGSTFEETCGPYFQDGVTAPGLDDAAIDRVAELLVGTCAIVEPDRGDVVWARLPDDSWVSFGGPAEWRRATAELVVADCEA